MSADSPAPLPPSPSETATREDELARLRRFNTEMQETLSRLGAFQKSLLQFREGASLEEALDAMELLLDEAVEFVYMRLFLRDEDGEYSIAREMCPDDLHLDWSILEWCTRNQEAAVIPLEAEEYPDEVASALLLPLQGPSRTEGVLLLWVDFDPSAFTQEQSMLLGMLAREAANILATHRYRRRIDEARQLMQNVVENVPHGILAFDAEGKIFLINRTVEIMLGINRAEALEHAYPHALPDKVTEAILRIQETRTHEEQELTVDLHGQEEAFGLSCNPIIVDTEEDPVGSVIVCRDLKLSREVHKLRELDAMKNDFLSLVSHELRTPLTSIMAYAETLLMEGMITDEAERKEYLQIIHEEGSRLSRLINDVLDLTKMEAGKMDYFFEPSNINDLLESAAATSRSLFDQKNQTLTLEPEENLPPVSMDRDRIMQVLTNLLSNASKYTPEEGSIFVRSRRIDAEEGEEGKEGRPASVEVSVQDTGVGISPENLNRVFSKFEQIEHIDHHTTGTGLGMPICRQIIEDGHGGTIGLESEVGQGTTVTFTLPLT